MGLLTIIRKQKLKDRESRVLVLGLDNSGKTTVVKKLMGDETQVSPTMGFEITTFAYHGHTINFWDIGGQTSLRTFWSNYFENTDAVVWVVDSASLERIDELARELKKLISEDRLIGVRLVVVVNKIDLVPTGEHARLRSDILGLLGVAASAVVLVSGKTGANVGAIAATLVNEPDAYEPDAFEPGAAQCV